MNHDCSYIFIRIDIDGMKKTKNQNKNNNNNNTHTMLWLLWRIDRSNGIMQFLIFIELLDGQQTMTQHLALDPQMYLQSKVHDYDAV